MKVTLITHTPDPEKLIATAAKLCYSNSDVENLSNGLTDEKVKSFIEMLMNLGHESPLEHVSFTFAVEGISRACSHQLVRHRIASYSQKSQRYVSESGFDYITPPSIEKHGYTNVLYDMIMDTIKEKYDYLHKYLAAEIMNDEGVDQKTAEKRANEDVRYILPNACETSIFVTMNIRSLFNFFKHRCCNRAQWEIRELAEEMYKLCMSVAPNVFKHAGPPCFTNNACPEGKMSCGKFMEMKNKYNTIIAESVLSEKDEK